MGSVRRAEADVFQTQNDAVLTQPNPASGTKYTILDTTKNVQIRSISVRVSWTVQPSPLEVWVTIDGQTIKHTFANPVTATYYLAEVLAEQLATAQGLIDSATRDPSKTRDFLYEGRSIKVQAEITGGTVSALDGRVKYAKIP